MTTNYPTILDTVTELKNDAANSTISSLTHPGAHNNLADAAIAIQTEVGVNPSGSFSTLKDRLDGTVHSTSAVTQTIQPTANVVPLILKAFASQSAARIFEIQASTGATLAYWDRLGVLSAAAFNINGVPLASTDLSDTANIIRLASPSITTPTISSPTLTGTPTAPTAAVDTNTTQVATTEFVKNQGYIPLDSPALTGTPTAPTPSLGDNDTSIATTAFVQSEIADRLISADPIGTIVAYAGSSAPTGWVICDGSAISRATYATLFGLIGTSYGSGDGSTTFNVPDLRGRTPVGKGSHVDVDTLGESDGVTVGNRRPKHAHSTSLSTTNGSHSHGGGSSDPQGSHSHTYTWASGTHGYTSGGGATAMTTLPDSNTGSGGGHSHSGSWNSSGSHGHTIGGTVGVSGMTDTPAYQVINYIIKREEV